MKVLLTVVFIGIASLLFSQNDLLKVNNKVEIETVDGTLFKGEIKEIYDDEVVIDSKSLGTVIIPIKNIKLIYADRNRKGEQSQSLDKKGIPMDFHSSIRYMISPTAYSLKKGQLYYENIDIVGNVFSYGFTDNITLSMGFETASLFALQFPAVYYFSSKYSYTIRENRHTTSLDASFLLLPKTDPKLVGFVRGGYTFGDRNNNLTLGTGFGFALGEGFAPVVPINFGFMKRFSTRFSLVSDNMILLGNEFDGSESLISLAMRIHFKNNGGAFNLGFFRDLGNSNFDFLGFPYLSILIALGDK